LIKSNESGKRYPKSFDKTGSVEKGFEMLESYI
jgi:hypothetical protein